MIHRSTPHSLFLLTVAAATMASASARADVVAQTFANPGSVKVTGGAPEGLLKIPGVDAFNPALGTLNDASIRVIFEVPANQNTMAFRNTADSAQSANTTVTLNCIVGWQYSLNTGSVFDTWNWQSSSTMESFEPMETRMVGAVSGDTTSTVAVDMLHNLVGNGSFTNVLFFNHVGSGTDNPAVEWAPGNNNGANVLSVIVSYDYTPVPAPGTLTAVGALAFTRRRR